MAKVRSEITRLPKSAKLFRAGYDFVQRNIDTADITHPFPAWHGWMVRQAFWEGARWEAERVADKKQSD